MFTQILGKYVLRYTYAEHTKGQKYLYISKNIQYVSWNLCMAQGCRADQILVGKIKFNFAEIKLSRNMSEEGVRSFFYRQTVWGLHSRASNHRLQIK